MAKDFIELRDAMHNELQRRGRAIPADTFSVQPATGVTMLTEHIRKTYESAIAMDPSKNWVDRVSQGRVVATDDIDDSIYYIRMLMATNIRR